MQTLQTIHGVVPGRKTGKLVSVAMVGSLHIAVIYTLLVALDIVPNPAAPPPGPISARVLDQTKTVPKPAPLPGPVLTHPTTLPKPTPPPIDIQNDRSADSSITPNRAIEPSAPVRPAPAVTLPLRAVAGTHTIPPYPPMAIRFGYEGTVRLRLAVDEHGNVSSADVVISSGHADLDDAAVNWVKGHWRYAPALRNGEAVPATTSAVVTFTLNQLRG